MAENKSNEIVKIDSALEILQEAEKNMVNMFSGVKDILSNAKTSFKVLEQEKQKLSRETDAKEKKIGELSASQQQLLEEYKAIKKDLEAFSKLAAQSDRKLDISEIQASLKIYTVLLNEVFSSAPHFKVLFLLHGDADTMTTEQLKGSSGISGAMILRACHELSRVNLIEFDENTKKAKLLQRLYPKKEKN